MGPEADDRYDWLDEEAAERMLRGEPAMPARGGFSERERADADRLAALLRAAQGAGGTRTGSRPLPGEEAALAAFREARAAQRGGFFRRPSGRLRGIRAGASLALIACTAGGVAVASGGVSLPPLLGGAPSVSSSEPGGSQHSGAPGSSGARPGTKDGGPSQSESGHAAGQESPEPSGSAPSGDASESAGQPDRERTDPAPENSGGRQDQAAYLDASCRAFLAAEEGTGEPPRGKVMRDLVREAGSEEAISAYCTDRLKEPGDSAAPSVSREPSAPASGDSGAEQQEGAPPELSPTP